MITPVVAAVNIKGGVGKTTTALYLAQGLAQDKLFNKNKPILIIDLDPQSYMSRCWKLSRKNKIDGSLYPVTNPELNGYNPEYSSTCDLWLKILYENGLNDFDESVAPIPYNTDNKLIHVVPAHETLMSLAANLPLLFLQEQPRLGYAMRNWLRSDDIKDKYSCVIIDTPPGKSALVEAALSAATAVYIPFVPEPQPICGVFSTISYIALQQEKRRSDAPLKILGLLPNMVSNTILHTMCLKEFRNSSVLGPLIMPFEYSHSVQHMDLCVNHEAMNSKFFALHVVRLLTDF